MTTLLETISDALPYHSNVCSALCGTEETFLFIPPEYQVGNVIETSSETITYILDKKPNKIFFIWNSEGFVVEVFDYMNHVIRELVHNFNFNIDSFYYVTGACNVPRNIEAYKSLMCSYPYVAPNVLFINTFEFMQNASSMNLTHELNNKEKKFLCFNRSARPHRTAILSELVNRNLLNHGYISAYELYRDVGDMCSTYPNLNNLDINISFLNELRPIKLSLGQAEDDFKYSDTPEDKLLFNNSMFSLITETLAISKPNHNYHCFPCTFMTEKTFKAIKASHPFIVMSTPHFLKDLRTMGYKTFHPYINESYDDIENDEQRLLAVMDEVERLSNLSPNEEIEWLTNVHEITKHNYHVLSIANQKTFLYDMRKM
jgi:hypothetical protein